MENLKTLMHGINGSHHILSGHEPVNLYISRNDKYINIEKNAVEDSHIHDVYEIYINISGEVSFLYNANVYKVEKGDIIFSAPGDIHHCIVHSSGVHDHYCIWFALPDKSYVKEYINSRKLCGFVKLSETHREAVLELAQKLEEDTVCDFEKNLYFYNLISNMSEKAESHNIKNEYIPRQIADVLEYIEKNFLEIESVEDVAERFYMSVATMNRKFREYIALSPYKFLIAKRLSYAEKLLRGGKSVAEACYACGFNDCSRFIQQFKKKYGMTPLKYKSKWGRGNFCDKSLNQ